MMRTFAPLLSALLLSPALVYEHLRFLYVGALLPRLVHVPSFVLLLLFVHLL